MKRNMNVKEIVEQLQQESLLKRDFVIPPSALEMYQDGRLSLLLPALYTNMETMLKSLNIKTSGENRYITQPNDLCHEHFSEKLKISKNYYDRMKNGHSGLLADNINYWLSKETNNYLLRTFINPEGTEGIARAFLSDRYKPIDNWDVAITILDIIKNYPSIKLDAADITDRKMYMRFVDPTIEHNAPDLLKKYKGGAETGIVAGFIVSNSEVGEGAFSVAPRAVVLACKNGLTRIEEKVRRVHLGGEMEQGQIQWSDKTKQKNLELIQSQASDAITQWLNVDYLKNLTNWLLDIQSKELNHPIDCTINICSELGLVGDKIEDILNHFMKDGDISPLGIAQSITYNSQTYNADLQFETEERVYELVNNIEKYDKVIKKK